jgi:hypothetical protein
MIRRSQEFGFHIENLVRTLVHGAPTKKNDVSIHDISKEENTLDNTETQSIKTTGGNNIDCGDVLRLFDYNYKEKHTMIVFCYKQESSKRVINRILELNMNEEFKKVLFGSVTREQIEELDKYIKGIPKNGRTKEHSDTYKKMAKQLKEKSNGWISYAPKVDSKSQRRLQCSIRDLNNFLEKNTSLVLSNTTECMLRGISFPKEHEGFGERIRHKKEELDLSLSSLQI